MKNGKHGIGGWLLWAAGALLVLALSAGCEHDKPGGGNGGGGTAGGGAGGTSITGSWKLVSDGGSAWYAHFSGDGTWKITDDAAGNARRVYGTYSCSGNRFSGPMVNPGVGEGKIEGTWEDGEMTMDFVEYWHTPAKHVPYTGTKM
jgi:hypothetical protein